MSAVLLISSVLIGLLVGRITHFQLPGNFVEIVLYALIFVVGIDLSKEKIEKRFVKDIALIIVSTVGGTLPFRFQVYDQIELAWYVMFCMIAGGQINSVPKSYCFKR